jgi:hypothetical protein
VHRPPPNRSGTKPLEAERRERRHHSLMKNRERVPYTPEVRSGDRSGRRRPPEKSSLNLASDTANTPAVATASAEEPARTRQKALDSAKRTASDSRRRRCRRRSASQPLRLHGRPGRKAKRATHSAPSSLATTAGRGPRRSSTSIEEGRVLGPLFGAANVRIAQPPSCGLRQEILEHRQAAAITIDWSRVAALDGASGRMADQS